MKEYTLNLRDHITSGMDEGSADLIWNLLNNIPDDYDRVCVDFEGVRNFPTYFFNMTFSRKLMEIGPDAFNKKYVITGESEFTRYVYKLSIENASDKYLKRHLGGT